MEACLKYRRRTGVYLDFLIIYSSLSVSILLEIFKLEYGGFVRRRLDTTFQAAQKISSWLADDGTRGRLL